MPLHLTHLPQTRQRSLCPDWGPTRLIRLVAQLSRQSRQRHCFDSQSRQRKSAAHTCPAVRRRFSISSLISRRSLFVAESAISKPSNMSHSQFCLFLFAEHWQFTQFPLQRQRGPFEARMTLLPLGAISEAFSPLKKRQLGGTVPILNWHLKMPQPKG